MFPARYWSLRYWAKRYWPKDGTNNPIPPIAGHTDWARNIATGVPAGLAVIAVHVHGTRTLVTLRGPNGVSLQTNPFVAAAHTGIYSWWAINGRYDETVTPLEGDGVPYTNADILLYDPS